jgi:hypothetical protein
VAGCLYAGRRERALGLDSVQPSLARMRDLIAAAIGKKALQPELTPQSGVKPMHDKRTQAS